MLRKANENILRSGDKAAEFLTDKLKIKIAVLNRALNYDDKKTMFSKREDHPEWFDGLETNSQTKEAYLHRRCQDRIRGYLYKTIEQIRSSDIYNNDTKARKQLQRVIIFFKLQLRKDHYFGYYFDRSCAVETETNDKSNNQAIDKDDDETDNSENCCYEHCPCKLSISAYERYILGLEDDDEVDAKKFVQAAESKKDQDDNLSKQRALEKEEMREAEEKCPYKFVVRNKEEARALCNKKGEFKCSGAWNRDSCLYADKHKINPYRSKEELVLFSTWNLDHKIERSRTIIPELLEASKKNEIDQNEVIEFYNNLFTTKNLRLVHIVCHDKGSHK